MFPAPELFDLDTGRAWDHILNEMIFVHLKNSSRSLPDIFAFPRLEDANLPKHVAMLLLKAVKIAA